MSYTRKGNSSPAYRYFLFILFLCIVLFVFLMSRLASGMKTEIEYEGMMVPALRVLNEVPLPDHALPDESVKPIEFVYTPPVRT